MNETCKSCGTVFDLDEKILSDKIHWLKCSVCNEKWSVSLEKNRIISEEKIEKTSINNSHNDEINKVKSELASIKLVVENKSKQMSNINNPILELKNKSVSEIAAELSASKLKTDNLKVIESIEQKKNTNQNNKTKILTLTSNCDHKNLRLCAAYPRCKFTINECEGSTIERCRMKQFWTHHKEEYVKLQKKTKKRKKKSTKY